MNGGCDPRIRSKKTEKKIQNLLSNASKSQGRIRRDLNQNEDKKLKEGRGSLCLLIKTKYKYMYTVHCTLCTLLFHTTFSVSSRVFLEDAVVSHDFEKKEEEEYGLKRE